jgi:hypothetical protein
MSESKFQLERVPGAPVSNEELLADIRRVAELAGTNVVSQRPYSESGKYDWTAACRRFGTWNQAVIAAGLKIANELNIIDERLFENLMRLWEYYGRQPRLVELARPPSVISDSPYKRRFHSWMDALAQFVAYANARDARPPSPTETAGGHLTGRDPSLRIRFRVMKRDNFSCRACGASPALQPGLSLHVDHIKPWSRGGETIDENLQTLCAQHVISEKVTCSKLSLEIGAPRPRDHPRARRIVGSCSTLLRRSSRWLRSFEHRGGFFGDDGAVEEAGILLAP